MNWRTFFDRYSYCCRGTGSDSDWWALRFDAHPSNPAGIEGDSCSPLDNPALARVFSQENSRKISFEIHRKMLIFGYLREPELKYPVCLYSLILLFFGL